MARAVVKLAERLSIGADPKPAVPNGLQQPWAWQLAPPQRDPLQPERSRSDFDVAEGNSCRWLAHEHSVIRLACDYAGLTRWYRAGTPELPAPQLAATCRPANAVAPNAGNSVASITTDFSDS